MDLGKLNSTTKITHEQILKQGDRLGDLGKELIKIELIWIELRIYFFNLLSFISYKQDRTSVGLLY